MEIDFLLMEGPGSTGMKEEATMLKSPHLRQGWKVIPDGRELWDLGWVTAVLPGGYLGSWGSPHLGDVSGNDPEFERPGSGRSYSLGVLTQGTEGE